jgi:hypothetical protein
MTDRHQKDLEDKIKNAPHQHKSDKASFVVYDKDGRFIYEMYAGAGMTMKVKTSTT